MGDVAQILGVKGGGSTPPSLPTHHHPSKAEAQLLAADKDLWNNDKKIKTPTTGLPPMVPQAIRVKEAGPDTVKVGNKWISTQKKARPWTWAPFASSSRTDGTMFYHWVRANVEYPDYPYARFDLHLDPLVYTDEEYQTLLASGAMTSLASEAMHSRKSLELSERP